MIYISNSSSETQEFASKFSKKLKGGNFICLNGELGAGKTTFVQGLATGLKITDKVISPTFILMKSYKIPETKTNLIHIDLYRLKDLQVDQLGIGELIDNKDNIVIVEWANKLATLNRDKKTIVNLSRISDTQRKIEII